MSDVELVIKLSEEIYDMVQNKLDFNGDLDKQKVKTLMLAIDNATLLPKSHKRLIEDNFKVGPIFDEEGNRVGYQYVTQEDLNNALTIVEAYRS